LILKVVNTNAISRHLTLGVGNSPSSLTPENSVSRATCDSSCYISFIKILDIWKCVPTLSGNDEKEIDFCLITFIYSKIKLREL